MSIVLDFMDCQVKNTFNLTSKLSSYCTCYSFFTVLSKNINYFTSVNKNSVLILRKSVRIQVWRVSRIFVNNGSSETVLPVPIGTGRRNFASSFFAGRFLSKFSYLREWIGKKTWKFNKKLKAFVSDRSIDYQESIIKVAVNGWNLCLACVGFIKTGMISKGCRFAWTFKLDVFRYCTRRD